MRALILLPLALFAAPLAGCLTALEPASEPDEGQDPATVLPGLLALPEAFEYVCPPGETEERGGLCVGTLESRTESLQEPYVAIHPTDPQVIAVGVNAGHTAGALSPSRPAPGADLVLLDVFFSEDGGATWRLSRLPYVPTDGGLFPIDLAAVGDPALAFDEAGVLHVSGIADQAFAGFETFYTSTPDLGRTWTEPVVFTEDGDNDRNWITVGPGGQVYVPWQNVGDSSELAWSLDGGATWRTQEPEQVAEGCVRVSRVAFVSGAPLLACTGEIGDFEPTGVRVFAFDPITGDLALLAELSSARGYRPQVVEAADGSLVMAYERDGGVFATRSADGGRSWSEGANLREAVVVEDAWWSVRLYWLEADPWGAVHLILGGRQEPLPTPGFGLLGERSAAHVVLDATTLAVLGQTSLVPTGALDSRRVPPSLGPPMSDDYHGLAFVGDQGIMVWTFDKGLDYTLIRPVAGEARSA